MRGIRFSSSWDHGATHVGDSGREKNQFVQKVGILRAWIRSFTPSWTPSDHGSRFILASSETLICMFHVDSIAGWSFCHKEHTDCVFLRHDGSVALELIAWISQPNLQAFVSPPPCIYNIHNDFILARERYQIDHLKDNHVFHTDLKVSNFRYCGRSPQTTVCCHTILFYLWVRHLVCLPVRIPCVWLAENFQF